MAAKDYFGNFGSNALGGVVNTGLGIISSMIAAKQNYKYGEMAADNADRRARALYEDYESPAARIRQLREAGLSPSLYADGAGGGAGSVGQGAQGTGAAGMGIPTGLMSPESLASVELMKAQANKANADARNTNVDTDIKEFEKEIKEMEKNLNTIDYNIATAYIGDENDPNAHKSIYEFSQDFDDFDKFLKALRETAEKTKNSNMVYVTDSAKGVEALRKVFTAKQRMNTEIATLSAQEVSMDFQRSIARALANTDFAKLNAQSAVKYLEANIATQALDEKQKEAWNKLLEHLGEKSETLQTIVIVLGMIINNVMANWSLPSIHGGFNVNHTTSNSTITTTSN